VLMLEPASEPGERSVQRGPSGLCTLDQARGPAPS
jgi:hypothetical protein